MICYNDIRFHPNLSVLLCLRKTYTITWSSFDNSRGSNVIQFISSFFTLSICCCCCFSYLETASGFSALKVILTVSVRSVAKESRKQLLLIFFRMSMPFCSLYFVPFLIRNQIALVEEFSKSLML